MGITPQGTISYVSQAWGGRTSDKFLTENCGILKKLLPGDLVLADRGFTIAESLMFQQAQLAIPAFTKGKDQLDPVDVEKTRGIANVRIHVERVIGLLRRKYSILSGILPIDFSVISNTNGSQEEATPMIDRIINVSAAYLLICAQTLCHLINWQRKVKGAWSAPPPPSPFQCSQYYGNHIMEQNYIAL